MPVLKHKQRGFAVPAALAAMLMNPWVIGGALLAIALTLGGLYVKGRMDGGQAATDRLTPKLVAAQQARDIAEIERKQAIAANDRLIHVIEKELRPAMALQEKAIADLATQRANAELELRKALVRFAESEKRWTAEHKRLVAIATGPVITENVLEETDAILRALARDRLDRVR